MKQTRKSPLIRTLLELNPDKNQEASRLAEVMERMREGGLTRAENEWLAGHQSQLSLSRSTFREEYSLKDGLEILAGSRFVSLEDKKLLRRILKLSKDETASRDYRGLSLSMDQRRCLLDRLGVTSLGEFEQLKEGAWRKAQKDDKVSVYLAKNPDLLNIINRIFTHASLLDTSLVSVSDTNFQRMTTRPPVWPGLLRHSVPLYASEGKLGLRHVSELMHYARIYGKDEDLPSEEDFEPMNWKTVDSTGGKLQKLKDELEVNWKPHLAGSLLPQLEALLSSKSALDRFKRQFEKHYFDS